MVCCFVELAMRVSAVELVLTGVTIGKACAATDLAIPFSITFNHIFIYDEFEIKPTTGNWTGNANLAMVDKVAI
jgi:hypothetical protein